ncbi:Serine/threonine-protein kinase, active site [Sesbania bispinosa]|nr:Serine/threonine-protein kinase, active site [Sesbania bispinosa]
MPIFSFLSHCFVPNGSRNHPSISIGSEVKGSQLMPVNSEDPSIADQMVSMDSKVPSRWSEPVPVISELPSSHGQSMSVGSEVLNGQSHISEIFKYSELEEATNNFDPSKILGSGGYGTVYSGILKDGRCVAIKRLHEDKFKIIRFHDKKLEGERHRVFMNEVSMLTCLRHENLVQLYGCTSPQSRELLLVQEYIPNGTVASHLRGKKRTFPWSTRLNIAIQTASALAYLHASNIIHRDVKTSNILLDRSLNAKVADFGLSRLIPHGVTHITTDPAGTPDFAMDKIICGQVQKLVDPHLGFESNSWTSETITAVSELAFSCLQPQRDMRPSMGEVLNTLESIRSGSSQNDLAWGSNSCYNATKVHVVSRLPDDYFEKK